MMDCLMTLEKKSFERFIEKETRRKDERMEKSLQKTIANLQKQKDLLQNKLQQDETDLDVDSLLDKKLKEIQWIYRLLGTSVNNSDNVTQLTLSTSYKGVFYESYIVHLKQEEPSKYVIEKHNLPSFIPLTQLNCWIEKGLKEFVCLLHDYLHAFICRRQEAEAIKTSWKEYLRGEVETAFGFSFVQFYLITSDDKSSNLEVKLTYEDPLQVLPSIAEIQSNGVKAMDKDLIKSCKDIFLSQKLSNAMQSVIGTLPLISTSSPANST